MSHSTVIILNILTCYYIAVYILMKIQSEIVPWGKLPPKDSNCKVNSIDPDHTAPEDVIWVCNTCLNLSVLKLGL